VGVPAGSHLGPFEILSPLGAGGMGEGRYRGIFDLVIFDGDFTTHDCRHRSACLTRNRRTLHRSPAQADR
jgi:hypothetical protein